jgi:serine/threonine-protein kinase
MSEQDPTQAVDVDPLVDKVIQGRFKLKKRLGTGGMGSVYVAEQLTFTRSVALKLLRPDIAGDEEFVRRFKLEAERAARTPHPRIVPIYDFGQAETGELFIAMEYVLGETLASLMDRGRLPIARSVSFGAQLADALHCVHEAGVVHRDVKPLNVMIRQGSDDLVLMDFGIARDVDDKEHLTRTGASPIGTPRYMAPEQILRNEVSCQSDIYSWGVVMFGMLAGRLPFEARDWAGITYQHVHEPPPLLSKLCPEVSPELAAIVMRALAKNPDERQRTMAEVAASLRALRTLTVDPRAGKAMDPVGQGPEPPLPRRLAAAPWRYAVVAAPIVALVAIGSGVLRTSWLDPSGQRPPDETHATAKPQAAEATKEVSPPAASRPGVETIAFSMPVDDRDITAVGMVDGTIGRYAENPDLLLADLRADARRQALEKAVGIFVARGDLDQQYEAIEEEFFTHTELVDQLSDDAKPRRSEAGLVYLPARANVRIQDLRRLIFRKSRDQRLALIRAQGDPLISVSVAIRDAERGSPIERSALAENVIKQRIRDFGYRVATPPAAGAGPPGGRGPDFAIESEAKLKPLSTRLAASGLTITKYVLTSWTVKCTELSTGEDIYFDNQLPKQRSWNDEDDALQEIGQQIADQFSQDFFAQHLPRTSRRSELKLLEVKSPEAVRLVGRELVALRSVVGIGMRESDGAATFEVYWYDQGPGGEQSFDGTVLAPLRRKLGTDCLEARSDVGAREVALRLADSCAEDLVARLEKLPPAALSEAPAARLEDVARSPEVMQHLLAINPSGVNALAERGVPDAVKAIRDARTRKVEL